MSYVKAVLSGAWLASSFRAISTGGESEHVKGCIGPSPRIPSTNGETRLITDFLVGGADAEGTATGFARQASLGEFESPEIHVVSPGS